MPDGERQAPQAILGEGLAEREPAPPLVAGQGSLAPARPPTASRSRRRTPPRPSPPPRIPARPCGRSPSSSRRGRRPPPEPPEGACPNSGGQVPPCPSREESHLQGIAKPVSGCRRGGKGVIAEDACLEQGFQGRNVVRLGLAAALSFVFAQPREGLAILVPKRCRRSLASAAARPRSRATPRARSTSSAGRAHDSATGTATPRALIGFEAVTRAHMPGVPAAERRERDWVELEIVRDCITNPPPRAS
jgi:hypothetical protein